MKKKLNTHVTGEHNINGNSNEALTGFQKANVNYTKTESGVGGFLFGVVLLILFGINAAFMVYVKNTLVTYKAAIQTELENQFNDKIKQLNKKNKYFFNF